MPPDATAKAQTPLNHLNIPPKSAIQIRAKRTAIAIHGCQLRGIISRETPASPTPNPRAANARSRRNGRA